MRTQILKYIEKKSKVDLGELAILLGTDEITIANEIAAMEQQIDDMTKNYREYHLQRMREGRCTEEACILYSELLTDFERIGDHALNIAQARVRISQD